MRILAYKPPIEDACFYFRIYSPLMYLQKNYPDVQVAFVTDLENITQEQLSYNDVFMFNRCFTSKGTEAWMKALSGEFKKIVCDIDDLWQLPNNHPIKDIWDKGNISEAIRISMKYADMVTTTNKRLSDRVIEVNKNVKIYNNAIDPDDKQFSTEKTKSDKIRFGFIGSSSHLHDLDLLKKPIEYLRKNYSDKVEFIFAGYADTPICNEMVNKIGECELMPLKSVHEYGEVYRNVDVVMVPLHDNHFNNCKSTLKLSECAMTHTVPFISNVAPYNDTELCYYPLIENYKEELDTLVNEFDTYKNRYVVPQLTNFINHCDQNIENITARRYSDLVKLLNE